MRGDTTIIAELNGLLAYEMTAADQYFVHAHVYEDMGLYRLYERIKHEQEEELEHAQKLIRRILFLQGKPDLGARQTPTIAGDVPGMLQADLDMELKVVSELRRVIALVEQKGDYVTRDLLLGLLYDTEEDHTHWLEQQLRLIDAIGIQNYLQSQADGRVSK
ncbi:bacterioferritin [Alkalilimnicola ehrlichii]|uniref:Bacterioferritin n=1 Tax=Alkalilimnicola ehrlichii TaxID=351052 RepID=A0A3E0WMY7_9GAMM|nr:bacterioferritin [Alkalilimnicola ehrlichii]RFA27791.1 bacterioferritin [Alkalilimnicola ehrlichii]RFA33563.1 bacterioferritin [Alkalilimnicola ehrlichii]